MKVSVSSLPRNLSESYNAKQFLPGLFNILLNLLCIFQSKVVRVGVSSHVLRYTAISDDYKAKYREEKMADNLLLLIFFR